MSCRGIIGGSGQGQVPRKKPSFRRESKEGEFGKEEPGARCWQDTPRRGITNEKNPLDLTLIMVDGAFQSEVEGWCFIKMANGKEAGVTTQKLKADLRLVLPPLK